MNISKTTYSYIYIIKNTPNLNLKYLLFAVRQIFLSFGLEHTHLWCLFGRANSYFMDEEEKGRWVMAAVMRHPDSCPEWRTWHPDCWNPAVVSLDSAGGRNCFFQSHTPSSGSPTPMTGSFSHDDVGETRRTLPRSGLFVASVPAVAETAFHPSSSLCPMWLLPSPSTHSDPRSHLVSVVEDASLGSLPVSQS